MRIGNQVVDGSVDLSTGHCLHYLSANVLQVLALLVTDCPLEVLDDLLELRSHGLVCTLVRRTFKWVLSSIAGSNLLM